MESTLAAEIFINLHELVHLFRDRIRKALEAVHPELTFNEMRVLMRVGQHAGMTQKDLVERSHTDKAQMARLLAQLEARGWLTRTPSDHDKRVRCLALSTEGKRLFNTLRKVQERAASEVLQDCPVATQKEFLHLILAVTSSTHHKIA